MARLGAKITELLVLQRSGKANLLRFALRRILVRLNFVFSVFLYPVKKITALKVKHECRTFITNFSDPNPNCSSLNRDGWLRKSQSNLERPCTLLSSSAGLQLVMNLDQGEYMKSGVTQAEGVRAAVFDPEVMILPSEYGIDVAPASRDG